MMRTMTNRTRVLLLFGLLSIFVAAIASGMLAATASAGESGETDVVILRCRLATEIAVVSYAASTGAPAKKSDSCAQALSQLLKDGFRIKQYGISDGTDYAVYTLLR